MLPAGRNWDEVERALAAREAALQGCPAEVQQRTPHLSFLLDSQLDAARIVKYPRAWLTLSVQHGKKPNVALVFTTLCRRATLVRLTARTLLTEPGLRSEPQ
eukprot:6200411-Pleurochrysis_carterae.AAC.4